MNLDEKQRKLSTLPWQALYNLGLEKGLDSEDMRNKEKNVIIVLLLENNLLTDEEIEELVDDYIYGDRITFTLFQFNQVLTKESYDIIEGLEGKIINNLSIDGFRHLQILSVEKIQDRYIILYVYSKEHSYFDENGHYATVWEQHRGCIWIGFERYYLACISKHDKMTAYMRQMISKEIGIMSKQIRPPKVAYERCINPRAISRIVLQGRDGEKTIISNSTGITQEQQEEIGRVSAGRFDTSGSYIADLGEDISATIKYNVRKGSIGIYKHLPSQLLFNWTHNAIRVIFEEVENLKGRPAEEIFAEIGEEIKWNAITSDETKQMNWFLTHVITAIDSEEEYVVEVEEYVKELLDNPKHFLKIPRAFCERCESDVVPHCSNCNLPLQISDNGEIFCSCGAKVAIICGECNQKCQVGYWYLLKSPLKRMIDRNVAKVYPGINLEYTLCIMDEQLHIVKSINENAEVEILFNDISCFHVEEEDRVYAEEIKQQAVRMKEKCGVKCSAKMINNCLSDDTMNCLPKLFHDTVPSYRPQPHKGGEYGDVAGQIQVGNHHYEMKAIIKKNSLNSSNSKKSDDKLINTHLLSTSPEGEEIYRQFIEQGMNDTRCQVIAIVAPQYFDASFKGSLRNLARLSKKKVVFVGLDEICQLIEMKKKL